MILAKYFCKQVRDDNLILKKKKVLELGSGTGIVSIMMANLGIFLIFKIISIKVKIILYIRS
jgi:ribosomal protein L11 methylase PrmA